MKAYFLCFESNHITSLKEGEIVEGMGNVEGKSFTVEKAEPFLHCEESSLPFGSESYTPLYLVKWDDANPKTLSDIQDVEEMDVDVDSITPTEINSIMETNLFRGLFKMKPRGSGMSIGKKKKIILMIALASGIGIVLYYLYWFGYIG